MSKVKSSLVSVIVTTKNEQLNIKTCLQSIRDQSYKEIEIIVVDNNSTDKTKRIASKFTPLVFNKGPERSTQRNFGAKKSRGKYLLFVDADMILSPGLVYEAIKKMKDNAYVGVVLPEISVGIGFWAKCKKLEKSFYEGNPDIEAARFFRTDIIRSVGGYDKNLISGEDWDLSNRVRELGFLTRTRSYIIHNDGELSLIRHLKKKFYYGQYISNYSKKNFGKNLPQLNPIMRFKLYFSSPRKLFYDPIVGVGMLFMKMLEFTAGGFGYLSNR